MKIILLSGGSGQRLWPLSNNSRSKQFLRVLTTPDGGKESMIQRVARQIREAGLTDEIVVATGANQLDAIGIQLGKDTAVVTEPERRDTFPAIALACSYLRSQGVSPDEPVIVMPCDSYTENSYFATIGKMARTVEDGVADLVLMGVRPTYPSAKYGYIVPAETPVDGQPTPVARFTEKPDVPKAEKLIEAGALWNGGVFAFRLGYLTAIADRYMPQAGFETLRARYGEMPKISFDYEVVEKADSVAVIPYSGDWRDLGTWNTLTDELSDLTHGNVITDSCSSTYVINELEIPVVCIGAKDFVVAASPDGILVADKSVSASIK
ncbi:MAG: NTP transferase domain-containing protein, partial [Muribaculaceae bacterium]|nr:NTP transferase domain-containing protein [Muribaculaceae bacterium]